MSEIKAILAVGYSVTMRQNPQDDQEPPKAYGNLQISGVVSTDQLAEHIMSHNSVFSRGTIVGCLAELEHCIRELILQGYKVQLGSIGTFVPTMTTTGASSLEKFSVENIKSYSVNFTPGHSLTNLREKVSFKKVAPRYVQNAALVGQLAGDETVDITPDGPDDEGGDGNG